MPRRLSRPCRLFRHRHAEFVDELLSVESARAMQDHLDCCPDCSTHDVQVRRSLLALQALPRIEPSTGFGERLSARLALEAREPWPTRHESGIRWGIVGAFVAASVALLLAASSGSHPAAPVRPAPVVAGPALRFEAVPGLGTTRRPPSTMNDPEVHLQLASFPGQ